MMENNSLNQQSFEVVVRDAEGKIKTTRYVKPFGPLRFEFVPNEFYLKLINSGRLQPNTWKVPFLFGSWTASKEHSHVSNDSPSSTGNS
jgi:hypothetical protein